MRSRTLRVPVKRSAIIAASVLWLAACPRPGDDGPEQTQSCTASTTVPTGDAKAFVGEPGTTPFKALAKGSVLTRHHGPQGGTHVYLDLLFYVNANAAGSWNVKSTFTRPGGEAESDDAYLRTCAGWNHVQNFRFVVDSLGDGSLQIAVAPSTNTKPEATTTPLDVTIR